MKASTKRIISLLFSAVFIVGAIFVYSSFVIPEYEAVNLMRGEYANKQAALDQQRNILANVQSILSKYQSIPQLNEVISLALPADDDVASAFEQLYAIASDSGLTIQQFSANTSIALKSAPTKASKTQVSLKPVGTAQISMTLAGSYASIKQFVQTIEKNIRIMNLVSLHVQSAGRPGQDLYLYNVVINAFYQGN